MFFNPVSTNRVPRGQRATAGGFTKKLNLTP